MSQMVMFFSYKGGVGRSLALCNTAAALCRQGFKVGLIDLDIEAPSLHLQLEESLPSPWRNSETTPDILSLLRTDFDSLTPQAVKEATIKLTLPWAEGPHCYLLPCFGRQHDLDALDSQKDWIDRIPLLEKICEMFCNARGLDFVLIDSRTGYSQQAIVAGMITTQLVAVARADKASSFGMRMILNIFRHKRIDIHLLITSVPDCVERHDSRLDQYIEMLGTTTEPLILPYIADWYFGGEVYWEENTINSGAVRVFDAIASKLLSVK